MISVLCCCKRFFGEHQSDEDSFSNISTTKVNTSISSINTSAFKNINEQSAKKYDNQLQLDLNEDRSIELINCMAVVANCKENILATKCSAISLKAEGLITLNHCNEGKAKAKGSIKAKGCQKIDLKADGKITTKETDADRVLANSVDIKNNSKIVRLFFSEDSIISDSKIKSITVFSNPKYNDTSKKGIHINNENVEVIKKQLPQQTTEKIVNIYLKNSTVENIEFEGWGKIFLQENSKVTGEVINGEVIRQSTI